MEQFLLVTFCDSPAGIGPSLQTDAQTGTRTDGRNHGRTDGQTDVEFSIVLHGWNKDFKSTGANLQKM